MNLRGRASRWAAGVALGAVAGVATLLARPVPAAAATFEIEVLRADGQPLAGAVVMVHGPPDARPAPAAATVIDQVDLTFVPDLLVVPVGSKVTFPNSDSVSHQVYSFSPSKRFQLPLYRGTPYPPVVFDRAGIATLGCNIHDDMIAYVVVTDASWFGRTGADGSWRAGAIPAGEYRVEVWHPRLREPGSHVERPLSLGGDQVGRLQVTLTKPLRHEPLGRKPHSWSGY